jgi:hypothetical protein
MPAPTCQEAALLQLRLLALLLHQGAVQSALHPHQPRTAGCCQQHVLLVHGQASLAMGSAVLLFLTPLLLLLRVRWVCRWLQWGEAEAQVEELCLPWL